jgi:molecular chaperone DnaJ
VKVRIPAGVDNEQRIRLKGRGEPGRNGGPAGDLIVLCRVQPHRVFGRDGLNLLLRVPVTFSEAALGSEIDIPLLDATRATVRLAPGTQNGSRQRIKGKGVETAKATGDLIVTFEIAVPMKLTAAQRKAVESLAQATAESPRDYLEVM